MSKLPRHLLNLSKSDLEGMCVDCGLCCHAQVKIDKGQTVLLPELRCKHLMVKSEGESCCSVYEQRFDVAGDWCFPLAQAIEKGLFPKECPYVADMQEYVGAKVLSDSQYQKMKPALQKAVTQVPVPQWVDPHQYSVFLNGEEYLAKSNNYDPAIHEMHKDDDSDG